MKKVKFVFILTVISGLLLLAMLPACIKDSFDFSKMSDSVHYSPSVGLPLAYTSLTLSKLVKERKDTVEFNGDTIRFVYHKDTLFSFMVDQVYKISEQQLAQKKFDLGILKLADVSLDKGVTLSQILNSQTPSIPFPPSGQQAIFLPIPLINAGKYDYEAFTTFSKVTFADGTLSVTFANNFPVAVKLKMYLKSLVEDSSVIIADLDFGRISAGSTTTKITSLVDKTMSNNVSVELYEFTSESSSPNFVTINQNASLQFTAELKNLQVKSGVAILPKVSIKTDTAVNFGVSNSERLKKLFLRSGTIHYSIQTVIPESANLKIKLTSATKNGQPLVFDLPVGTSGQTVQGDFDLAGCVIDLTTNPLQKYNYIPFTFEFQIDSTGIPREFNLQNSMMFDFKLNNLKYKRAEGYFLGQKRMSIKFDTYDLDFDFFDKIDGGLALTNPIIKIHTANSVGIPVWIDTVVMLGRSNFGKTVDLNVNKLGPIVAPMPDFNNTQLVKKTFVFDRNNTDIVPFLALPPRHIEVWGSAISNPMGDDTTNYNAVNFVTDSSRVFAGIDIEVPVELKTSKLVIKDTISVDVSEAVKKGGVESAFLFVKTLNGFPLDLNLVLIPLEKNTHRALDSIRIDALQSADVNPQTGIVVKPRESTAKVLIGKAQLESLKNSDKLIIRAEIKTANQGTIGVKLLTYYKLDLNIAIKANFSLRP